HRYDAELQRERAAESAAGLAFGHLDELEARHTREQGPRLALHAHLAQSRAGVMIGDGGRKRSGHGYELEHPLEKVGQLIGLGRKRVRALEQPRIVAEEI